MIKLILTLKIWKPINGVTDCSQHISEITFNCRFGKAVNLIHRKQFHGSNLPIL